MRVTINRRHLDERLDGKFQLTVKPTGVSFVPGGEGRVQEYIFVYKQHLPTLQTEPALFSIAQRVITQGNEQVILEFPKAEVYLVTRRADDEFRINNPEMTDEYEAISIFS